MMDEVFIDNVKNDNLNCWTNKVESAILSRQSGLMPNSNFFCDVQFHSIVNKALERKEWLRLCDLERIINVYYRITGT